MVEHVAWIEVLQEVPQHIAGNDAVQQVLALNVSENSDQGTVERTLKLSKHTLMRRTGCFWAGRMTRGTDQKRCVSRVFMTKELQPKPFLVGQINTGI